MFTIALIWVILQWRFHGLKTPERHNSLQKCSKADFCKTESLLVTDQAGGSWNSFSFLHKSLEFSWFTVAVQTVAPVIHPFRSCLRWKWFCDAFRATHLKDIIPPVDLNLSSLIFMLRWQLKDGFNCSSGTNFMHMSQEESFPNSYIFTNSYPKALVAIFIF